MALSSLASLGTAPLVVWGRLVCLYLKFPDSEFDVRAGLLVGGLAGRLSPHKCTRLAASPGEHRRGTEPGRGWLVAKCPAWELRSLSLFLAPLAWHSCFLCPLLAKNSPTGSPRGLREAQQCWGPRAASGALGAECCGRPVPVCGAVSCVTSSRGLLTFSEIILQHIGHGSQSRRLSWLGWQEVRRSALWLWGGGRKNKRNSPKAWAGPEVPGKEQQFQEPSREDGSKSQEL